MAEVWYCKEGSRPADGYEQYELSVEECLRTLSLGDAYYFGDLKGPSPKFNVNSVLGDHIEYRHVVVKVTAEEGRSNLPAGFYILPLKPHEVTKLMGRPPAPANRSIQ